jgi:hypothetical protein
MFFFMGHVYHGHFFAQGTGRDGFRNASEVRDVREEDRATERV